jgi:hypothetical protein
MMDVFKKMWPDAWGVRMEHILRNVLMALLEQPDATSCHELSKLLPVRAEWTGMEGVWSATATPK